VGAALDSTIQTDFEITLPESVSTAIKTHGSVSCGPRKRGVRKRSKYIDRNNKVAIFTHP